LIRYYLAVIHTTVWQPFTLQIGGVGKCVATLLIAAAADGSTGAVQIGDPQLDVRGVARSPDGSTLAEAATPTRSRCIR
jgi:hypothetical protein